MAQRPPPSKEEVLLEKVLESCPFKFVLSGVMGACLQHALERNARGKGEREREREMDGEEEGEHMDACGKDLGQQSGNA